MTLSNYNAPTRVTFGRHAEDNVGEEILRQGSRKVLIHYGSSRIEKNGLLDKVTSALEDKGIGYVLLGGVVPNPRLSLVRKGITLAKEHKVDFILAIGGDLSSTRPKPSVTASIITVMSGTSILEKQSHPCHSLSDAYSRLPQQARR